MADVRKISIAIVLVALAAASWWFTRDATQPLTINDPKKRHDPDYIVEKFKATAMDEHGSPKYLLTAQRLTHYPDDDTAHFVEPLLIQHQPNGTQITTWANSGVMPGDGKEIVMKDNVRVTRTGTAANAKSEIQTDRLRVELDRE